MKKLICALAVVFSIGLGGFTAWEVLQSDRKPPVITFQTDIQYSDVLTEEELLEGVIAKDEQDGDVSDTLVIESISQNETDQVAIVSYAARDKSNNVSIVKRILKVTEDDALPDKEDSDASGGNNEQPKEESKKQTEKKETEQKKEPVDESESAAKEDNTEAVDPETDETDADNFGRTNGSNPASNEGSIKQNMASPETEPEPESESETESEELAPGSPVIKLTANKAEIKVGANFVPLNYVASVQDDLDNIYALWRDIQITGDYDIHKVGTYTLTFYVVDSSGNTSNHAKLKLTVKP